MKKLIFEHEIDIPDWQPGMELLNEGLSYEDSYWKRIEFPKLFWDIKEYTNSSGDKFVTKMYSYKTIYNSDGQLTHVSTEDSNMIKELIIKDIHRRKNGVHMKNGNDIVWIAPDYYFFLQWFQQKDIDADENGNRLGSFRMIQNDALQLWEYVKWNPEIAGLIIPKIKKCGITYLFCGAFLNEATSTRNNDFLAMSKDFETCKLSLFTFMKYGYDELPYLLKPFASKLNLTEIFFGKPKDKKNQNLVRGEYLKSMIKACKTKTAAFDGPVPYRCWDDEFPKKWEASKVGVKETFDKSVEAIKKNQKICGKLLMTSYMPEEANRGFFEARTICEQSLLSTIKPGNLRTESNMIIFPIYAYQSNQECFDKYGHCDEKKARAIVAKMRSEKQNKRDLITSKRQYPLCWDDMFANVGAGSAYDNERISPFYEQLKKDDKNGIRYYKEGNLRWENTMYEVSRPNGKYSKVYFEELTTQEIREGKVGTFKVFHDLNDTPTLSHLLNPVITSDFAPSRGVMSIDPVDFKLASDVKEASMNGSYGGFVPDIKMDQLAQKVITNVPIFEYNFRHENPNMILEDLIKAVIYWGFYVIIENNKGWVFTEFKLHGLEKFLLVRQKDGTITPWIEFEENHGGNKPISTDEAMINAYMLATKKYISKPTVESGIDYLSMLKSINLLSQLMDFNPLDTRRYDLAVALGYWRIGIECVQIWELYKNEKKEVKTNFTPQVLAAILG